MRCDDCLDDLPPTHFVVYELVNVSEDPDEPDCPDDYDEKHICADCVGWYGDCAVEVEA